MIDLTDQEKIAIDATVKNVAEIMAEIGWSVRLNELTRQQVQLLIEVAVDGFQWAMRCTAVSAEEGHSDGCH